jgi:hypothetical protein
VCKFGNSVGTFWIMAVLFTLIRIILHFFLTLFLRSNIFIWIVTVKVGIGSVAYEVLGWKNSYCVYSWYISLVFALLVIIFCLSHLHFIPFRNPTLFRSHHTNNSAKSSCCIIKPLINLSFITPTIIRTCLFTFELPFSFNQLAFQTCSQSLLILGNVVISLS